MNMKQLGNDFFIFEIYIGDLAESADIKTATELESFSEELHCRIENACRDYADDFSITDYDPQY